MGKYNGMVYVYDEEESLAHYGIMGQKWGIRRFQNEDRTLTPEGKERYYGKSDSRQAQKHENGEFNPRERWGSKNSTYSEVEFEMSIYSSAENKKLMENLKSIINKSDDPEIQKAKKLADQYSNEIDKLNDAFDRFYKKYTEEHGHYFDGDGTEAHWEFEKLYPEYKQIYDGFCKTKGKFIDLVTKLAESDKFDSVKEFDQYKNYFDEIQDPKTGEYWYKYASVKAIPIALAMFNDLIGDLFHQDLIASYDSKGNVLYKPWDEET